jgi:transposase
MAGCCRLVWNKALALNLSRLEHKQSILWYNEVAYWLTFWKSTDDLSFLKECHSQPLLQTLKNLDKAFKDAFDKIKQKNPKI